MDIKSESDCHTQFRIVELCHHQSLRFPIMAFSPIPIAHLGTNATCTNPSADYLIILGPDEPRRQEQREVKLSSAVHVCNVILHAASGSTKSRPEVIYARHGAVATDDGRCSKIGMTVLREGGHVVDASVAATLCLGVVSAASSGIGGGAFMLIRQGNGKAQAFDMRETAPR
ncbi:hypothetical protein ACLB2K_007789 [Fragaria x ananassa]